VTMIIFWIVISKNSNMKINICLHYVSICSMEYFNTIEVKKSQKLNFFEVIDELGGTTQTDHLDCRISKTQVSTCPENLISCQKSPMKQRRTSF
jgi:hypothetical protein